MNKKIWKSTEFGYLYQWAVVMAVATPYGSRGHRHSNYSICICIMIIVGYVLSTLGRIRECYPYFNTITLIVTDFVSNLILTIQNVLSILVPAYWFRGDLYTFVTACTQIHKFSDIPAKLIAKEKKKCNVKLCIGHILMIALFIYDGYVCTLKMSWKGYRNYIFMYLQNYYAFIVIMLMHKILITFHIQFLSFNNLLKVISIGPCIYDRTSNIQNMYIKLFDLENQIRQLHQLYGMLSEQVSLFNKIFGWQILFSTAVIFTGILTILSWITSFRVFDKEINFGLEMILLTIWWGLLQYVLGIILASACDTVLTEAQRTGEICYKLLLHLPSISENPQDQALREQLKLLAERSTLRCPSFSAAGFFEVNYSMLLALFGSITSYFVVILQFD